MESRQYYAVVTSVFVESVATFQKMAGYVPATDEQHAYKVAKAYCMDRYKCPMYMVTIEAIKVASDQQLAANIPIAIDTRSYQELMSSKGLFSVEREILEQIPNSSDQK